MKHTAWGAVSSLGTKNVLRQIAFVSCPVHLATLPTYTLAYSNHSSLLCCCYRFCFRFSNKLLGIVGYGFTKSRCSTSRTRGNNATSWASQHQIERAERVGERQFNPFGTGADSLFRTTKVVGCRFKSACKLREAVVSFTELKNECFIQSGLR